MSIKIGNMLLENNNLLHKNSIIELNHLKEFNDFLSFTQNKTVEAISELIEPMNLRLIRFNNELQIIKVTDNENEYSSTQHYLMLNKYSLDENRENFESDLNFIIGYNLLIYILSQKEENKHLELDGIKIAQYIISTAWTSGFVTEKQFDEYYMSIYKHDNRADLFRDRNYKIKPPSPHTLAKPITFNFGNYDSILTTDYIFKYPHSDIVVFDDYIIFNQYAHTLKIKNNSSSLFEQIPEGTSMFKYINNKFRVEKTKIRPKNTTSTFSENYMIVLRHQNQSIPRISLY